jgi:opacity protein-like surface antigen
MPVQESLLKLIALCLLVCLILAPTSQVQAFSDQAFALAMFSVGTTGFSTLAYYLWKNSPAQRVHGYPENLTQGEYYLAGYGGAALLPAQDWTFSGGFKPPLQGLTAQGVSLQPGVLGGLKFGHYFNALPWFGLEMETNYSKNSIRGQRVSLSSPLPSGAQSIYIPRDRFYIWCMQTNLIARYGFWPDKEYPFGRLQPYIGIGPAFEIMYGISDSSKNLAIATLAGIRYMATAHIGVFLEYKFSYQFAVEYEYKQISPNQIGTVTFDVPNNRIVFGVAYHFKNLFGN